MAKRRALFGRQQRANYDLYQNRAENTIKIKVWLLQAHYFLKALRIYGENLWLKLYKDKTQNQLEGRMKNIYNRQ